MGETSITWCTIISSPLQVSPWRDRHGDTCRGELMKVRNGHKSYYLYCRTGSCYGLLVTRQCRCGTFVSNPNYAVKRRQQKSGG